MIPTPEQVRAARQAAGLSQTAAAALIHSALRSWQDWEAGKRKMHPAFWELFNLKIKQLSKRTQ
jgi:DNA-binding transcriptional regulator YiaG